MVTHSPSQILPAVDERLIMPDAGYEVLDGKVVAVSPALEPHGSRHSKVSALLEAYVAPGYNAASDMLTRASAFDDLAPHASVYPIERDPSTGGRRLEELAFEVVSTETLAHAGRKAARLVARGVRRVFAIDVERSRGLEWSARTEGWEILAGDAVIEDPALVLPLAIHDLVATADADDAVARALLAKRNAVLTASIDAAAAQAAAEARAQDVITVLVARGLAPAAEQRAAILAVRDPAALERLLIAATTCDDVERLLADAARAP